MKKVRIVKLGNEWYLSMNCCPGGHVYKAGSLTGCFKLYNLHNRLVGHAYLNRV